MTDPHSRLIEKVAIGLFGAAVHEIIVNHKGKSRNIVLGYDTPDEYVPPLRPQGHPYHGSTVGRYANRIKHGKFSLNGQEYQLAINNGPNGLHGGVKGISERMWIIERQSANEVTLRITCDDGEEGYPCKIQIDCTYKLERDSLKVYHQAILADPEEKRSTIVNLTNHSYFNLSD